MDYPRWVKVASLGLDVVVESAADQEAIDDGRVVYEVVNSAQGQTVKYRTFPKPAPKLVENKKTKS